MLKILALMSLLAVEDVSFDGLNEQEFVQIVTTENKSFFRLVTKVENDKLTVLNIETQKEQTFEKSKLKLIRTDVADRTVAENVGVGPWVAWQLAPQFKEASKRQTIASIQQAAVFVTVNQYAGLNVGDQVDVFRLGDAIVDPTTGDVLDTPEQKIAKLEVIAIAERLMTCRPIGEFVIELKVGDVVRPTQPRTSVAVLPFMNGSGGIVKSGVNLADETTNALTNLGVPTIERVRTSEILGEQLGQLSSVYEGGDASRVGKLLGAATLVTGRLIETTGKRRTMTLSVRLLDVQTGTILKTVEVELSAAKLDMTTGSLNRNNQSQPFSKGAKWVGLAMPMKGPDFKAYFSEISINITAQNGTGFSGKFNWVSNSDAGRQNEGSHTLSGNSIDGKVNWIGDNSSEGTLSDGIMLLDSVHGDHVAEFWLVSESDSMSHAEIAGTYKVLENGKEAFKLTLNLDGTARKSHAPSELGRWIGTQSQQRILVCWTSGWRDVLTRAPDGWTKEAFPPAVSLKGRAKNPGLVVKIN